MSSLAPREGPFAAFVTPLPRPFTAAEDSIIMHESQTMKRSCRHISKLLPDRTRVAINKRLKKLLRIRKSMEKTAAQASTGAAMKIVSKRTPRPKGTKSRWYAEDDAYLRSGGSVDALASKYGCSSVLVQKRKDALMLKDREEAVNARRLGKALN